MYSGGGGQDNTVNYIKIKKSEGKTIQPFSFKSTAKSTEIHSSSLSSTSYLMDGGGGGRMLIMTTPHKMTTCS